MPKIKQLLHPKILIPAFGITLLLSLCGKFVFPEIFAAGAGQAGFLHPAAGLFLVPATCLLAIYLLSLLFVGVTDGERKPFTYFKGFLALLLIELAVMPVVGALNGLLSVLIHAVARPSLTQEKIEGVIDATASILLLLVIPVFIHILMVFGTQERKVTQSIRAGLKSLKKVYLRILLTILVLFSAGYLCGLPFRYTQTTVATNIIQAIIGALIGGLGVIAVVAICPQRNSVNRKKRPALDDTVQQPGRKQETKEPVTV